MQYYQKILVTVICESFLEKKIVAAAKEIGVRGYTVVPARGEGDRGIRGGDFEFSKNIKIEILCRKETADTLCETIYNKFFDDYAVIFYRSTVDVLRSDKFK